MIQVPQEAIWSFLGIAAVLAGAYLRHDRMLTAHREQMASVKRSLRYIRANLERSSKKGRRR